MKKSRERNFGFSRRWVVSGFLLIFLVLSVSNCKEKIEGCPDIEAENYSFSADKPCSDDCCEYPSMTFEVAFRWRDTPLTYNQPLQITFDTLIKITKTKLYISDIRLTNDTETFRVFDQITLSANDGSGAEAFVDDFALLSRDITSFNYEIGEIRGSGSFDSLRFFVGLNESVNQIDPMSTPENHPLAIESDSLWSEEGKYIFNKLVLIPMSDSTVKRRIYEVSGDDKAEVVLPFKIDLEIGNNITVPLVIDYYKWLQNINFTAGSSQVDSSLVVKKIVKNTPQAFSINE